jgi:hypothetical protein
VEVISDEIMATRRGYDDEYRVKQILTGRFGDHNVLKIAISQQGPDYLCLNIAEGMVFGFEVKGRKEKKFSLRKEHDIPQFHMIKEWSQKTGVPVKYFLLTRVNGKVLDEEISLQEFEARYILKQTDKTMTET